MVTSLTYGVIHFNNPDKNGYLVRGVDVSAWQGEIDWQVLSQENIDFAFIKATEGSSFIDKQFTYNWEKARNTNLLVGAYHFFSYDSSGDTQADHFIQTVPLADALPPVVDIEFYGDTQRNPPARTHVTPHLQNLLKRLEEHYGKKPILYATMKSYRFYLQDEYPDYPIWIRNVNWMFWQFMNRAKLRGYKGKETFIDLNVFSGTPEEWLSFTENNNKPQ